MTGICQPIHARLTKTTVSSRPDQCWRTIHMLCNIGSLDISDLKPLSIPPSGSWQGVDGRWSTFHVQVGTLAIAPEGCTEENPGLWNCEEERGDVFIANKSSTWSTSQIGNKTYYNLNPVIESMLGLNANASYGLDAVALGTPDDGLPTLPNQLVARIASNDFWVGVLGLSPQRLNTSSFSDPVPTLMGTLSDADNRTIPSTTWAYTAGAYYKDAPIFGSLTLGGNDDRCFDTNQSVTVPFSINPSQDLQVNLQSIILSADDTTPLLTETITVYINSMIPYIWLPPEVCNVFEAQLGIEYDTTTELYLLNETTNDRLGALAPDFSFTLAGANSSDTATIVLPYAALDLNVSCPHRAQYISQYTLGIVFLQEAYVIADYDRRNFTVAQALFPSNSTRELITILPPDESNISNNSLADGAIAGIVIAGIATSALVALAYWLWRRRRSSKTSTAGPAAVTEQIAEAHGREIQEKSGQEVVLPRDQKYADAYKQKMSFTSDTQNPSRLPSGQTPSSMLNEGSWPLQYSELPGEISSVPDLGRRDGE
ncbi:hypothetical protein DOTSEDRAFT_87784 [Dothistroma septosporum NZE10]|uniref:Peptidase A1 domain-containing protein n=1 Tax=Dothistroma septosporum (strain NZE10 / CBS 128990) TaxID=675120 RepID=N1PST9_DOTSN|nr:hypothetical protein DOTSEDRAFT_87784 [Dothistroma septosporum NZE10]